MPRNGNGTYILPNPILIGQLRSSSAVNEDYTDIGDELTNSLPVDGQAGMTGQFQGGEGEVTEPEISFAVDLNSGFHREANNELHWIGGAIVRAKFGPTGLCTFLNGIDVTGSVNISSVLGVQALTATGAAPMTLRREENDTSEHEMVSFEAGSGAGAKGSLRVVGSASNNVSMIRYYVNSAKVFELSQQLLAFAGDMQVGTQGIRASSTGYVDFAEMTAAPTAPAGGVARLYAKDVGGLTDLFYKTDAGEANFGSDLDQQIFTASGTWTKPTRGEFAMIEVWGGGGSGSKINHTGTATSSTIAGGAGGGGGGYVRKLMSLASLSSSVAVVVGAGGVSQTSTQSAGNDGGDSSFGAYAQAFGGAGAGTSASAGGGGGLTSAGEQGNSDNAGNGGGPSAEAFPPDGATSQPALGSLAWGFGGQKVLKIENNANPFGGGAGTTAGLEGAVFGGGGGGVGGESSTDGTVGGYSLFGGAGGGGSSGTGGAGAGGTSFMGGGAGGAGGVTSGNGTDGTAPGGGGGGCRLGNSGAGARGEVRITVW